MTIEQVDSIVYMYSDFSGGEPLKIVVLLTLFDCLRPDRPQPIGAGPAVFSKIIYHPIDSLSSNFL